MNMRETDVVTIGMYVLVIGTLGIIEENGNFFISAHKVVDLRYTTLSLVCLIYNSSSDPNRESLWYLEFA